MFQLILTLVIAGAVNGNLPNAGMSAAVATPLPFNTLQACMRAGEQWQRQQSRFPLVRVADFLCVDR